MKTLEDYVEANLNFKSAEQSFIKELCSTLNLDESNIKKIEYKTVEHDTKIVQYISIILIGKNKIHSQDISKIKGLSITTPLTLEIEVGEIHL